MQAYRLEFKISLDFFAYFELPDDALISDYDNLVGDIEAYVREAVDKKRLFDSDGRTIILRVPDGTALFGEHLEGIGHIYNARRALNPINRYLPQKG